MKIHLLLSICLFLLIGITACDSGKNGGAENNVLSEKKQKAMMTLSRNLILQKELAKMAMENTVTQNAKVYGQELLTWAEAKHNELQEYAKQYNVALPNEMEKRQMKHIRDVTKEKATDHKYDEELWDSIKDAQRDAAEDFMEAMKDFDKEEVTPYSLWLQNTSKELRSYLTKAAKYDLELKNREGGISKPILENMKK